jgi:drug/metabolite transporter (DMT)-like permease
MPGRMSRRPTLVAYLQVFAGIGALCIMDALVKYLALRHGAPLTTFGRYASGTVVALGVWAIQGRPGFGPGGLKAHLVRGTLIAGMALSFFWAITQLTLSLALTLAFVGPLLVPPMAAIFLREPMQPRFVIAGLIGFLGVVVAAGGVPDLGGTRLLAVLAAVGAALLYGLAALVLRARAAADGATLITLMGALVPALLLTPALLEFEPLSQLDMALMVAMGIIGNIGVQLLARGYVHLEAQASAVMEFTGLPWAALLGWLYFDEAVAPATLAGAAIIAGACLWAARTPRAALTQPPAPVP